MSFADKFVKTAQRILPSPFTIAVLLTGFTIVLALLFTESKYNHVLIEYKGQKKTVSLQKTQKLKYAINDEDSISIKIEAPNIVRVEDAYGIQLAAWKYDKKNKDLPLYNNFNIEPGLSLKTSLTQNPEPYLFQMFGFWEGGFFNFLGFAMQMMLILVLGHVLALTRPANRAIQALVKHCDTTPKAAFLVTFVSIFVALLNWGLALVLGAIFARKVGEYAARNQISLNYPLI
ncbi:MAG: TIGR00366 family protein, partial [Saprospiraceae bacterium]|nr:TIGR00366 family protein [Saprospiraceae bacterium]